VQDFFQYGKEVWMSISAEAGNTTIHRYDSLDYVGTDPLYRDQVQSRRLHEPRMMNSSIDPISGRDIGDPDGRPFIVDGNLVIYFESKQTRQEYLDMPMDHSLRLPDNPTGDGVAEG